ncbi:MAG: hypothetical protein IJ480_11745 [Clostridia bacterium]|nr:hypothetical protein [Clostridia bacterium]
MEIIRMLQYAAWILTGILALCYGCQAIYILLPLFSGRLWNSDAAVSPTIRYIALLIAARHDKAASLPEEAAEQENIPDLPEPVRRQNISASANRNPAGFPFQNRRPYPLSCLYVAMIPLLSDSG